MACGGSCTSVPDTSTPGTSHSTRSSGSGSSEDCSEDCSSTQVPSAAHWPLSEPIVYVPRAQNPREGSFSSATKPVQPLDDPGNGDAVGTEEGGGSDEKLAAYQEEHRGTVETCKYSVQCSYLQMNTHSSRSHTIVQFTISRTTGKPSSPAPHISCGGESIGAASGRAPTATSQRREKHQPRGEGKNADRSEAGSETLIDREIFDGSSTSVSGGGESCVYPIVTTRAKLSLVDLAGSEKGRVGGERGTERAESRSQAGGMQTQGEARLLQDSLVGGKTVVIATIRPSVDAQAESISTLNFAARCMRVVAKQRVNEVVTDSLLLERARRQISALRRRLVEAEAAAAIASSPAPPHHLLPSEKAETPPPCAKTRPALPSPLPAETETGAPAPPKTSGGPFSGSDDNGPSGVRNETARSGGGRRPALPARGADCLAAASITKAAVTGERRVAEASVATQALIERFSSREEELLREVLQKCAYEWCRRLPHVAREPRREKAGANRRLEGDTASKQGESLSRAVDNRAVLPASGVVAAAESVAQDGLKETHGIDKPAGEEAADVERAAPRKAQPEANKVGGEKYGQSKEPTPFAVESRVRLPQKEGAEMIGVCERSPSKSFGAKDKTGYGGDNDRHAQGSDGISSNAESGSGKPRVIRAAVDAAPTQRSFRGTTRNPRSPRGIPAQLGKAETHGKDTAEQGTTAGGPHLEIRSLFASEGLEVAPTPSLSLPLSPDPARDTGFVNADKIDGKGCQRHGLAPCSLCGVARDSSLLRLSDDGSSAPPVAERVKGDGPCDRHLLLNCILCKMLSPAPFRDGLPPASFGRTTEQRHVVGRSSSLPALCGAAAGGGGGRTNGGGRSGGGADITDVQVPVRATKLALGGVGSPSTYRCDRHDLVGCVLCGSIMKSPPGPPGRSPADSRHADDALAFSPAPPRLVLPSPTLHGGGSLHVGGASPIGAFMDQPLRNRKGASAALGSGSAISAIDTVSRVGEGGNNGVSKNGDLELGRSILLRAPHLAGAARKMSNDVAVSSDAEEVGAEQCVANAANGADCCVIDRRPSSSQPTPSRGGFRRKNGRSENAENQTLAVGRGTVRVRGSPDRMSHAGHDYGKSSTDVARARGVPRRRGLDAAGHVVRHRRQHRSRDGAPRRRTPSKPSMADVVGGDPSRSRGNRSLHGNNNKEISRVVPSRAQANTVISANRAREKLADDDLAAKAMTAALAVLQ
eukprot:g13539.t1